VTTRTPTKKQALLSHLEEAHNLLHPPKKNATYAALVDIHAGLHADAFLTHRHDPDGIVPVNIYLVPPWGGSSRDDQYWKLVINGSRKNISTHQILRGTNFGDHEGAKKAAEHFLGWAPTWAKEGRGFVAS